ncbi:MAG: cation:proton antiporter [Desulfurococcaceae archaeon TW002]
MDSSLILLIAASQWIALLLTRYGVPSIPVYVILGALYANFLSTDQASTPLLSVALLFLFFYAGINVDLDSVRRRLRDVLVLTSLNVSLTVVFVSLLLMSLNTDLLASLVVGVALANTATEIAVVVLQESGIDLLAVRNLIVAASFIDDLLLVFLVALIQSAVFRASFSVSFGAVLLNIVFLGVPFIISYVLFKPVSRMSWSEFVVFTSALAFTLSLLPRWLGVSECLGAYVAGLTLSVLRMRRDPTLTYSTKLSRLLDYLTTYMKFLIYPLFFVVLGTLSSITSFIEVSTLLLLITAFLGKFLGFIIYTRVFSKLSVGESFFGGLVMNSRGSIESALTLTAYLNGLLDTGLFQSTIAVVVLSSIIIPFMIRVIIIKRLIY